MLCAAIDIGSNTTRVLVAEPQSGQLRKVMEQRAYTRIDKASQHDGAVDQAKIDELAAVVATQVHLAQEIGARAIRTVATAAIREAANRDDIVAEINRVAGVDVEILSEHEEGRLAFIGATKTLGHPVEGDVAVVDVGGGSSEVVLGTVPDGLRSVQSFKIGSGSLADDLLSSDPPSPSEIRAVRDAIATSSRMRSSSSRNRRSPSAGARPRCARWSARCWSTRRSSGRFAFSPATRSRT
jgi:exopolyphosphatase/guanosine-5'-triphosphate,3'-diphosphate pyrophosphatase